MPGTLSSSNVCWIVLIHRVLKVFLTLALAKISICLFLLRLSQFEKLRYFLYGLIVFIALTHLPLFLLIVFQCNPVSKNWHPDRPGSCFSREALEGITNAQGGNLMPDNLLATAHALLTILTSHIHNHRLHLRGLPDSTPSEDDHQMENQAGLITADGIGRSV